MAHTAATFKARFEEFTPLGDSVVSAALAEATRRTDVRVLGDRFDDAVAGGNAIETHACFSMRRRISSTKPSFDKSCMRWG